jgi:hypothetical protein
VPVTPFFILEARDPQRVVGHMTALKPSSAGRLKERRRRPEEGGDEWEPIKILHRNLAYILKMTRRTSLLTQPKPPSYRSAIGPRNRARNRSENTERC